MAGCSFRQVGWGDFEPLVSQWAKEQGLTYKGAWRMWKAGPLPVPAEQLPTGTIIVKEIKAPAHAVGLYARVSSSDQRKDLEAP